MLDVVYSIQSRFCFVYSQRSNSFYTAWIMLKYPVVKNCNFLIKIESKYPILAFELLRDTNHYQINILVWYYYWYWLWRMSLTFQHWSASLKWWWSWEIAPLEKSAPGLGGAAWNWLHQHQWRSIYFEFNVQLIT